MNTLDKAIDELLKNYGHYVASDFRLQRGQTINPEKYPLISREEAKQALKALIADQTAFLQPSTLPIITKLPKGVTVYNQAAVDEQVRLGRIDELKHWADFFSDPSMNAMTPSERLYKRISDLDKEEK